MLYISFHHGQEISFSALFFLQQNHAWVTQKQTKWYSRNDFYSRLKVRSSKVSWKFGSRQLACCYSLFSPSNSLKPSVDSITPNPLMCSWQFMVMEDIEISLERIA